MNKGGQQYDQTGSPTKQSIQDPPSIARLPGNVEILIQIIDLVQVLFLHLVTDLALLTVGVLLGEQELVDHNVVGVDVVGSQLLNHTLRLVQGQELGDAHTDERGLVGILELVVDFCNDLTHALQLAKHILGVALHAHHSRHLLHHGSKTSAQLGHLGKSLLQDTGERQEAKRVSSRRSVKDNDRVLHGFDLPRIERGGN